MPFNFFATKRYAVVTLANKGIGFEICKQLASSGIKLVLTSRDEKIGIEAIYKLVTEEPSLVDLVDFHQLDVAGRHNAVALADFVNTQFDKLDILVNNAGVLGHRVDADALRNVVANGWIVHAKLQWTRQL